MPDYLSSPRVTPTTSFLPAIAITPIRNAKSTDYWYKQKSPCSSNASTPEKHHSPKSKSLPHKLTPLSNSSPDEAQKQSYVEKIGAKKLLKEIEAGVKSIYDKVDGEFLYVKIKESHPASMADYKLVQKVQDILDASTKLFKIFDWSNNQDPNLYVIKTLIEEDGADLKAISTYGATILHDAVLRSIHNNYSSLDVIEFLLKAGANNNDMSELENIVPFAIAQDYNLKSHRQLLELLSAYQAIDVMAIWQNLPRELIDSYIAALSGENNYPDDF